MAAQEFDELLFPHGLYLAGLNSFGGHLVRHIGQHGAQSHHIAGTGNLQDHGFAVARGGRDLDLAKADDKHIARGIAFGKQLGAAGMAHHDPNLVVISQRLRREIAEHPQMAVLAIEAIFRRVMGMECGHTSTSGARR